MVAERCVLVRARDVFLAWRTFSQGVSVSFMLETWISITDAWRGNWQIQLLEAKLLLAF